MATKNVTGVEWRVTEVPSNTIRARNCKRTNFSGNLSRVTRHLPPLMFSENCTQGHRAITFREF